MSDNNLINDVMGTLAENGFFSPEKFVDAALKEISHHLIELGVVGIRRKFALDLVRDDLMTNIEEVIATTDKGHFQTLGSRQRFEAIKPRYYYQLVDEEVVDDLIDVWVDQVLEAQRPMPERFPATLAMAIREKDKKWAETNLDKNVPEKNFLFNRDLCQLAFEKAGLA